MEMNACLTFYINTLLYIMLWHFMSTYFSSIVSAQPNKNRGDEPEYTL